MRTSIRTAAVAIAAAGALLAGATTMQASAAEPSPSAGDDSLVRSPESNGAADASNDPQFKKVWKNVWRNAPSEEMAEGDPSDGDPFWEVGTLYAGSNYFYCQTGGPTRHLGEYSNDRWLLTDDDVGNENVLVNAVYISGGDNYEPIAGVPPCNW